MSETRPVVDRFADQMEQKLSENRHKGDRGGWLATEPAELLRRTAEELSELSDAIEAGEDPSNVWREAADVANMAMMAADTYVWLRSHPSAEH